MRSGRIHTPLLCCRSPPNPQGWSRFTTGHFELHEMEGHHLWPLEKASKAVWLGAIAAQLEQLAL